MIQPSTKSKIIDIYLASMVARQMTHKSHLSVLKLRKSADTSERKLIEYLEKKIANGAIKIKREDA
jgi:hypothetical protein